MILLLLSFLSSCHYLLNSSSPYTELWLLSSLVALSLFQGWLSVLDFQVHRCCPPVLINFYGTRRVWLIRTWWRQFSNPRDLSRGRWWWGPRWRSGRPTAAWIGSACSGTRTQSRSSPRFCRAVRWTWVPCPGWPWSKCWSPAACRVSFCTPRMSRWLWFHPRWCRTGFCSSSVWTGCWVKFAGPDCLTLCPCLWKVFMMIGKKTTGKFIYLLHLSILFSILFVQTGSK